MARAINESDWRLFRKLEPIALDRFCERVLSEINQISSDSNKTSHQRYVAIFKLLERRDRELADAFNDLRRSTAWRQLALIQSHGLLTEKEMADFTAETRGVIELLNRLAAANYRPLWAQHGSGQGAFFAPPLCASFKRGRGCRAHFAATN